MAQIYKIIKAWINVVSRFTTKEHKRRASICNNCTHKKYTKYLDFINDDLKEVRGFICTDCGCPLIAKIRSTDICNKWKHTN
jgi:TPP-dependent indolepyruvate ferredoxin oxidoreductase alpha subunit